MGTHLNLDRGEGGLRFDGMTAGAGDNRVAPFGMDVPFHILRVYNRWRFLANCCKIFKVFDFNLFISHNVDNPLCLFFCINYLSNLFKYKWIPVFAGMTAGKNDYV